ncbi:DUF928 domain-containing protein [Microseira sp. BLCC-F43]|uniref:DUF928 domain-containing protein n=1 Tax=Microseira sp. BLCC-F43 TaxID=3153602 RepID=UPI0035B7C073
MTSSKSTLRLIPALLTLWVLVAPNFTPSVRSQNRATSFEPPPGKGIPRRGTAGGGSRPVSSACDPSKRTVSSATLTALSPGSHLGLTQSSRPKFLVYVPQTTAQTMEFSLFDEQMNGVYQMNFPVANRTGLIRIELPENAPSLVKDKPYYWTVALICNPNERTEDMVVGGWIERTELNDSLKQELAKLRGLDRVSFYAKRGFWYDAVNTLVELGQAEPGNLALAASWAEVLKSVGLEAIALTSYQLPVTRL